MQVIEPRHYTKKEQTNFRLSLLWGTGLIVGGIILFLLPLTGLISKEIVRSDVGFWSLVLVGITLLAAGIWLARLAWLYYDEQQVQAKVIKILERVLNDDFKYLRNLNSLASKSSISLKNPWFLGNVDEAGGVLLGPHGAWVLQICRYKGIYACEGDTWYKYNDLQRIRSRAETENYLDKRRLDDSPNWRVIRAAREVKAWLSVRELPQVTVQPIVVLAHGKIRVSKRPSCPIVELWYLETYIKKTLVNASVAEPELELVSGTVVSQIVERLKN